MSWHLSSVLFFLVVTCCTYGPAHAKNSVKNNADIFVAGQTKVPKKRDEELKEITYFQSFSFVAADGLMVAFAAAESSLDGNKSIDILACYTGSERTNGAENVTESEGKHWKTNLAFQKMETMNTTYELMNPVAVARGNKIYLLVAVYKYAKDEYNTYNFLDWDFEMSVGEIKPTTEAAGGKTIKWKTREVLLPTLTQQFKDQGLDVVESGVVSSLLTESGRIVFVLEAKKEDEYLHAIIHSKENEDDSVLDLTYAGTAESCYSPQLFEWDGKLIITPAYCPDDKHGVKESTDLGKSWSVVGSTARVWDNLRDKYDFTTATIDNEKVLLFTQERKFGPGNNTKQGIYLWLSSGNRVHNIGPIVAFDDILTFKSLLYTQGELFYLRQQVENAPYKVFLTRLRKRLERINSVLRTWAEKDEYLSRPCNETASTGVYSGTLCLTPVPTDGLVGFLSDSGNSTYWHDEYLYVNATVKGGTKVANGFKFTGAGSGAQWSIGKQGVDERYNFARYGLTIVATVTIHEVPERDTPLLTLDGVNNAERLGLWYGKDNKWKLMPKNSEVSGTSWEVNQTYRVAFIVQNKSLSVYIDGKLLGDPLQVSASMAGGLENQQVFIGGYDSDNVKGAVSHVTFTNVFLYNRALNDIELKALNKKRPATPKPKNPSEETPKPKDAEKNTTEQTDSMEHFPGPTNLGDYFPKPRKPEKDITKPKDAEKNTTEQTDSMEHFPGPTNLGDYFPKPRKPEKDIAKPKDAEENTTEQTDSMEHFPRPTNLGDYFPKPRKPEKDIAKPKDAEKNTTEQTDSMEHLPGSTNSGEITPSTTESKEYALSTRGRMDSSVQMPVGGTLLSMLGLWGLYAFC